MFTCFDELSCFISERTSKRISGDVNAITFEKLSQKFIMVVSGWIVVDCLDKPPQLVWKDPLYIYKLFSEIA